MSVSRTNCEWRWEELGMWIGRIGNVIRIICSGHGKNLKRTFKRLGIEIVRTVNGIERTCAFE